PHDPIAKQAPFAATEPGMSGLETLLPLSLSLVEQQLLALPQLIEALTAAPARILGIEAGTLNIGSQADICIFDPDAGWTVSTDNLISAGKNTPFLGQTLKGRVNATLMDGRIVFRR
ncbi:MAG: amidohydrolase family protein, partial [Oceanospirillales bacterium]|nr:amidohydrolase family protein [Oceanospirillales bacterium]